MATMSNSTATSRATVTLVASILVSACYVEPVAEKLGTDGGRQFSPEEIRIARKLSLGNNSMLGETSDPVKQAMLCRDSLEAVEKRLADAGALGGEQIKAFQAAKLFYEREISLGSGKASVSSTPQNGMARDNANVSAAGRTAMACLQRLQDMTGTR